MTEQEVANVLTRLAQTPSNLAAIIMAQRESTLTTPGAAGEWSAGTDRLLRRRRSLRCSPLQRPDLAAGL
jgi:hypothetical protein